MAQIFVSHSQRDKNLIHFFMEAFAGTKVKPHFEELEKAPPTGVNAQKIEYDIQNSNALFIMLSENVENLNHTRDWVNWESGTAKNKDIWVFEPADSFGKIRIVVPRFNHYVRYSINEDWRIYLRNIIETYDDSHVLPALSASTAGGALLNQKDVATGAAAGFFAGLAGLILHNVAKPSYGIAVKCPVCFSNYKVHGYGFFRCAVCNSELRLDAQPSFGTAAD